MSKQNNTSRVLVTGGHSRIGQAITCLLAAEGMHPCIHYRTGADRANLLANQLMSAAGARPDTMECDLCDADLAVATLVAAPALPWDAIVFNASAFEFDDAANIDSALWQKMHAVHYETSVKVACAMAKRNPNVALVFILDQAVANPNRDFLSYTLSKSALHAALPVLAVALAPARVNAVCPGLTLPSYGQSLDEFSAIHNATILKRGNTADDVARAVLFLLQSPAITGQVIFVDGGQRFTSVERDRVLTN